MLANQRKMSVVCSRSGYLETIWRNKMQNKSIQSTHAPSENSEVTVNTKNRFLYLNNYRIEN